MSSNVFMNNQLERIADYIDAGKAGGGSLTIDVTGAGDMQGATATAAGLHGLVPAPAAGDENKVLSGAGTWIDAGSGVELGDLEDVTITSPTSGESLKYDGAKWVNGNVTAELPDFIEETSGNIVTVEAAERPAKSLKVAINPVQSGSGDPSPDNIRPISGWTGCNVVVSPTTDAEDGTTYTITFPSEAGTVYGGTLDVVNGVLTVTWTKTNLQSLNFTVMNMGGKTYFRASANWVNRIPTGEVSNLKSNILKTVSSTSGFIANDYAIARSTGSTDYLYLIFDQTIITEKDAKQWIEDNDFYIVYELKPERYFTYQLTPTEVQMLLGTNNIWADTGEVKELKYIPKTYNDLLEEVTGGVNYSTSEHDTGLKWIDGKAIYQKTISFIVAGGGYVRNPTGITGIDTLIKHEGIGRITDFIVNETPYRDPPTHNYSIAIMYAFDDGVLHADYRATTEAVGATFFITLWYTKI